MAERQKREEWGSRIGVILAVAGSAVGLGNFLRFPGLAAQNGGGAFLIPYFVALLVLGIPLGWAEWTMGRYGGLRGFNSAPGIFSTIWKNRLAKYFGSIALVVPLVICMYYVVIEAWCLGYAWYYLTGALDLGPDRVAYENFFANFIGLAEDGMLFRVQHGQLLLFLALTFLVNFVVIYRGLAKGIEEFCKWALPIMAICALFVLVRVMTLGTPDPAKPEQNVLNGLGFMWNPQWQALGNFQTWLAAAGQVFFTLGVGFGIIINYSSYLKKDDDIVLSSLTASSMNEFFEVCLGGMITIPAAFLFFGAASGGHGTFDLGFKVLPNVFALMPAGRLFGFLWFVMLFLAAITSSLAMLQPVIAFFEEGLGMRRHASVAFLALFSGIGSVLVVYFSKGGIALDSLDYWGGTMLLMVLATIQSILYGWVWGIEKGEREAHLGAHLRIPHFVQFVLKYVSPAFLIAILIGSVYSDVSKYLDTLLTSLMNGGSLPTVLWRDLNRTLVDRPVASMSLAFVVFVTMFFCLLVHIAGKRWRAEGKLPVAEGGKQP